MFQSLAVNNNESTGGTHIGAAATSVTVITSSGVVSYQHGGSIPVGRAAGWAVNFDRLLRDKVGLATFTVSSLKRALFLSCVLSLAVPVSSIHACGCFEDNAVVDCRFCVCAILNLMSLYDAHAS